MDVLIIHNVQYHWCAGQLDRCQGGQRFILIEGNAENSPDRNTTQDLLDPCNCLSQRCRSMPNPVSACTNFVSPEEAVRMQDDQLLLLTQNVLEERTGAMTN